MPEKNAARSVKEIVMDEDDDQRQFFGDLAATARQAVEEVRGVEENYYAAVHWAILPFPWLTDINERLQSYVEQYFKDGFDYALELSQAKDFHEFTLINTRWSQKSIESLLAQAKDFAETYTFPILSKKAPAPPSVASA
jgi:hypothetical protein